MNEDITAGGEISLAALKSRREASDKILETVLGPYAAKLASTDKRYLKFLLPVLHSEGKDLAAVANLREAVLGPPQQLPPPRPVPNDISKPRPHRVGILT